MPASLSLDTARSDQGKLVLTAVGEIDLSNVESFSQALRGSLSEATDAAVTSPSISVPSNTSTVPPSTCYFRMRNVSG